MYSIAFLHPDLGIGGAERLIIDLALALKEFDYSIQIFTSHHDHNHCFKETIDGRLSVITVGDWLPRSTFGLFIAFWAYIRMIYLTIYMLFNYNKYDLIICDQIPIGIPLLKLFNNICLFYCHFPDQLLTKRNSILKKIYRYPIDFIEEWSIGKSDRILVNSNFTKDIFYKTFKSLNNLSTTVLYPVVRFKDNNEQSPTTTIKKDCKINFLSINRFERKKNIELAIKALRSLLDRLNFQKENDLNKIHLIIAGGYDLNNQENIDYAIELEQLANELNLLNHITFIKNITDNDKIELIKNSMAVIYTPSNEHFGIVPIESMYYGCPVIATNNGGPRETIIDNETGFLCQPNSCQSFSDAMYKFYTDQNLKQSMSKKCHQHVINKFNYENFKNNLNQIVNKLLLL